MICLVARLEFHFLFNCITAAIHIANGEEEKGTRILKGATTSLFATAGGLAGGPAGAIAAAAASDALITAADSIDNKKFTPFGIIDYAANIDKVSVGDHFDQALGIGLEFAGGHYGSKKFGSGKKGGGVRFEHEPIRSLSTDGHGRNFGSTTHERNFGSGTHDKNFGSSTYERNFISGTHDRHFGSSTHERNFGSATHERLRSHGSESRFGADAPHRTPIAHREAELHAAPEIDIGANTGNKHRTFNEFFESDGGVRKSNIETGAMTPRRRLNKHLPDFDKIDINNPIHLNALRRLSELPESHRSRLEAIDFRTVNDVEGRMNCYYCSLAALKKETVSELQKKIHIDPLPNGAPSVPYIIDLYKRAGFKQTILAFAGTPIEFWRYLDNTLVNGESIQFSLAFHRTDGTGHVVHLRAWKDLHNGKTNVLTTDFQQPAYTKKRFSNDIPKNAARLYAIYPEHTWHLGDLNTGSLKEIYQRRPGSI